MSVSSSISAQVLRIQYPSYCRPILKGVDGDTNFQAYRLVFNILEDVGIIILLGPT